LAPYESLPVFDPLVADHPEPARTGLVEQTVEGVLGEPVAPGSYRGNRKFQLVGQHGI
jgi:hypothetical protein